MTSKAIPLLDVVDHLVVQAGDAREVFEFFNQTLGLTASPLTSSGGFTTTRILAGDVEIDCASSDWPPWNTSAANACLTGVVFRSGVSSAAASCELQRRGFSVCRDACAGIRCQPWLRGSVVVTGVVQPLDEPLGYAVQLSEFTDKPDVTVAAEPGLLGWTAIEEVCIETSDLTAGLDRWNRFFCPRTSSEEGIWSLAKGPRLRIGKGTTNRFHGFVARVQSLGLAAKFLSARGVKFSVGRRYLIIAPSAACGLHIVLTESQREGGREWVQ